MLRTATIRRSKTPRPKTAARPAMNSPEWNAWRTAQILKNGAPRDLDVDDPKSPVGHESGIRITTFLIRTYREMHRRDAMDITPQQVIDVLVKAGVKKWVLMGLHGYAGYLPQPRSTQDVDVMVAQPERKKAVKAISAAWPKLIVRQCDVVSRFLDPNSPDADGLPSPAIDIMQPWSTYQQTILKEFVKIDPKTKHRIPKLEAALVFMYGAMISTFRSLENKEQDTADFRRIVRANFDKIDRESLRRLAAEVWDNGAKEIEEFLDIAMSNKPFKL